MKTFESNVTTVMLFLQNDGYSPSVISAHKLCYQALHDFLVSSGLSYSHDNAYRWIRDLQPSISYRKYTSWRNFINQLEDVRKMGQISPDHLSCRKPPYYQLKPSLRNALDEFTEGTTFNK